MEQAYIEFRTHAVTITRTEEGDIRCFKFTKPGFTPRCEYEAFTTVDQATEWIVTPFSIDYFVLSLQE